MNTTQKSLVLGTILVFAFFLLGNSGYVLPVPDGGELNPSPPSLVGTLKSVSGADITVLPKDSASPVVVRIIKDTKIFTQAGGYVTPEKLVVDGLIEIWFTPESLKNKSDPPVAAVIRVEIRNVSYDHQK